MERSSVNAGRPAARSAAGGPHASAAGLWTADGAAADARAAADGATYVRAARVSVRPVPPRRTEVLLVPGDVSHDARAMCSGTVCPPGGGSARAGKAGAGKARPEHRQDRVQIGCG